MKKAIIFICLHFRMLGDRERHLKSTTIFSVVMTRIWFHFKFIASSEKRRTNYTPNITITKQKKSLRINKIAI